ncbi:hemicentin-2-like [Thrips palmi]|uniref:Hemicentin-2-like n=1 Tax=Thrips palmi TaxID=161013 RepID=A0A6P8Y227_THRPL|nr:hemicentin-2-like [Thrips palmi]
MGSTPGMTAVFPRVGSVQQAGAGSAVVARVTREEALMVSDTVAVEITPQNVIVAKFIGDNYVASCNTSDGSKPRWFAGRGGAAIQGTSGGTAVSGTVWRGPTGGLQIYISKINKADRGEYCCRMTDGKRPAERCFELTVKEPIEFLDTPTEQTATEGNPAIIKCEVTGDPQPEIQWKVRGQPWNVAAPHLNQIADGLSITEVTVSDQGLYECTAIQMSEQVASQRSRNITLRVRHKPKFLSSPPNSPTVVFGYLTGEVNLTCAVSADPPASIAWYPEKDRQQLTEPMASRVTHELNKSTLRVKLSNATVFGKYRCRAKNEIGSVQRDILLQQGVQPKPPHHVTVASVGATIAVLDVQTPVVGPKVQQSTQSSHKSGKDGASAAATKNPGANDTLGYRVRLTRTINGTDLSFEQDCDPAPCQLRSLTPGTNYTTRIATRGRAGLSDWVVGPMLTTAFPNVKLETQNGRRRN